MGNVSLRISLQRSRENARSNVRVCLTCHGTLRRDEVRRRDCSEGKPLGFGLQGVWEMFSFKMREFKRLQPLL